MQRATSIAHSFSGPHIAHTGTSATARAFLREAAASSTSIIRSERATIFWAAAAGAVRAGRGSEKEGREVRTGVVVTGRPQVPIYNRAAPTRKGDQKRGKRSVLKSASEVINSKLGRNGKQKRGDKR